GVCDSCADCVSCVHFRKGDTEAGGDFPRRQSDLRSASAARSSPFAALGRSKRKRRKRRKHSAADYCHRRKAPLQRVNVYGDNGAGTFTAGICSFIFLPNIFLPFLGKMLIFLPP
ncbi:MAG: hypothetical protein KY475_01280, partial [Planctomycetes bacterium]|nr:hypothetical protein [Planctomycetota bacterium]